MRSLLLALVLLTWGATAFGQQAAPNEASEARYLQFLDAASALEAAGRLPEAEQVRRQAERERGRLQAELERLQAEVDRLRRLVGMSPRILVQVRMMEFSRTKLRALGLDAKPIDGEAESGGTPLRDADSMRFRVLDDAQPLLVFLEALREKKLLRVLAEPALSAVSGQPAVYNVGGEFPVLAPTESGRTSVEYRPYGTRVDLTADLFGGKTIRLKFRIRHSELDPDRGAEQSGIKLPGLRVRNLDSGAEVQSGQTLVITGLRQSRTETTRRKPPLVGDLPGLGGLLTRTEEKTDEVEMLVLLTAQVVPTATAERAAVMEAQRGLQLQYDRRR